MKRLSHEWMKSRESTQTEELRAWINMSW
jgi:hypothetical protein